MPVPPPESAKRVFHGQFLDIWQWDQALYDGTTAIFESATRPDVASVLCFLDRETVLLTLQEQPHRPQPFIDLAGGRIDPGENPEQAARRELMEETGYSAANIMEWSRYAQRGITRFEEFFFVAANLIQDHQPHPEAGERILLKPTPWKDVVQLCLERRFRQLNTMLAILQMEYDPASKKRLQGWLDGCFLHKS